MLSRKEVEAFLTGKQSTSFTADGKGIKRAPRTDEVSKSLLAALDRGVELVETPRTKLTDTEFDSLVRTNTMGVFIQSISEVKTEKERVDGNASRNYVTVKYVAAEPGAFPDRTFTRNINQGYEDPVTRQKPVWFKNSSPETLKSLMDSNTVIKAAVMTAQVEPYATSPRKDSEGKEYIPVVDTFTALVLPGEDPQRVFEQVFGHKLAKSKSLPSHTGSERLVV